MSATAVATRELLLVEAINDALHVELARDETVMVLGEDVGRLGGVFRATAGLRDRFGPTAASTRRSRRPGSSAPRSALHGGLAPRRRDAVRRVLLPCLDQLITHVGRYRWRTGGRMGFPLVIRMPYGGGVRAPELHDDSPETYYVHTPGVKVAVPSTPVDAKPPRGGDPRPGSCRRPRAEARVPHRAWFRAAGRACRRAGARAAAPPGPT